MKSSVAVMLVLYIVHFAMLVDAITLEERVKSSLRGTDKYYYDNTKIDFGNTNYQPPKSMDLGSIPTESESTSSSSNSLGFGFGDSNQENNINNQKQSGNSDGFKFGFGFDEMNEPSTTLAPFSFHFDNSIKNTKTDAGTKPTITMAPFSFNFGESNNDFWGSKTSDNDDQDMVVPGIALPDNIQDSSSNDAAISSTNFWA